MGTEKSRQYEHRQIRTAGGWLVVGHEYNYQDGPHHARVRLLRDRSTDDELKFRLEILSSNTLQCPPGSRLTITSDWEGRGSWRLLEAMEAG